MTTRRTTPRARSASSRSGAALLTAGLAALVCAPAPTAVAAAPASQPPAAATTAAATVPAAASVPSPAPRRPLPVVFVHGNSGSAAQFESQFQRFTSNGYRQSRLFAYEYDTSGPDNTAAVADLDPFIDDVLRRTGAEQVFLVAHSRGTTVSLAYLADAAHAGKVAKYVNLDGRSADAPPGGVPTLAIWGEWQSPPTPRRGTVGAIAGATNIYNPDLGHTETSTSGKTFREVYRFFLGRQPRTTDVLRQAGPRIRVAGRAVLFPENEGFAGARLDVYRVWEDTGKRAARTPVASYEIGEDGRFGPLALARSNAYEFALTRPGGTVHHFYQQRFRRDDLFLRLNSAQEGVGLETFTPTSPEHVNAAVIRAREMWGDQGADSDVLTVDELGDGQAPLNVLTPQTSPRSSTSGPLGNVGEQNAMFLTDVGAPLTTGPGYGPPDQQTDLGKGQLYPFSALTFLGGVDVFLPADERGRTTVQFGLEPRGGRIRQVVNVPNWPSATHRISVGFRDDVQER